MDTQQHSSLYGGVNQGNVLCRGRKNTRCHVAAWRCTPASCLLSQGGEGIVKTILYQANGRFGALMAAYVLPLIDRNILTILAGPICEEFFISQLSRSDMRRSGVCHAGGFMPVLNARNMS